MARSVGVRANDPIDVKDRAVLNRLFTAIIAHENGSNPYAQATIAEGCGGP